MNIALRLAFLSTLLWLTLLPACVSQTPQLLLQAAQQADGDISIINIDYEPIKAQMFGIAGAENVWRDMLSFLSQNESTGAWTTLTHIESLDLYKEPYSTNPNRISPYCPTTVRSLIRNSYFKPHNLRLIFMLDYQQIPVISNNQGKALYYDLPVLQPGEEFALEYTLPPLAPGLHHFALLLITDPESENDDLLYRLQQQLSFGEQRYSLWVGVQELDRADMILGAVDPSYDPVHHSRGLQLAEFIEHMPIEEEPRRIHRLQLQAGIVHEINLSLTASQLEENSEVQSGQTFPVIVGVFWNDEMHQVFKYDFPVLQEHKHEIVLPIHVPEKPGQQQLMVVVFSAPHSRAFDNQGQRVLYPQTAFSQRVLVDVIP